MRAVTVVLLGMCIVVSGVAAETGSKKSGESACMAEPHAHQYGDIRMAMIEVTQADQCGFSFADLEENTVGLNNSFQFASNFQVLRMEQREKKNLAVVKIELSKKAIKRGMRGLVTYCSVCKNVFTFRPAEAPPVSVASNQ